MLASPASTTVRTSNGSTSSWSELIEPDVYCACADRARAEASARSMGDRVVERRADDRDVDLAPSELGRIGDPRQLHERGRPDVGRQVVVVVRLVLAVPAVGVREIAVEVGIVVGAQPRSSSGGRSRRRNAAVGSVSLGAPPVRNPSSSGARRAMVHQPAVREQLPRQARQPRTSSGILRTARTRSGRRGWRRAA